MHHPVDGGHRCHGVGEDVLPLGEDQVRGYAQRPALVAFGDEGEEHLGLIGTLGLETVAKLVDFSCLQLFSVDFPFPQISSSAVVI